MCIEQHNQAIKTGRHLSASAHRAATAPGGHAVTVKPCGTLGRHSERYRGAYSLLLHFSLHTQLVPDPDRCLLCSPCNNSTVDHLQIKEECLPKASTADTVSDGLADQEAPGRTRHTKGKAKVRPWCGCRAVRGIRAPLGDAANRRAGSVVVGADILQPCGRLFSAMTRRHTTNKVPAHSSQCLECVCRFAVQGCRAPMERSRPQDPPQCDVTH